MKTNLKASLTNAFTCVALLFACFFMYDFYKCLSGFIANGFREPSVMLPMVLSYLLPVICFLFYFYDFYVKGTKKVAKIIYSVFVILYAAICLIFVFKNIELYISNNKFGVYDALPSIFLHFPYDVIVIHFVLIALQVFNIATVISPTSQAAKFKEGLRMAGSFKLRVWEYIPLCILAIVVFVFSGASIYATFSAFENAFYDFRYIFLLLWVFIVPMMNLGFLVFKPEKRDIPAMAKIITLCSGIAINIIFATLLEVLESTYPDFMVHIGKPLFLIAFSVSLPIEMGVILGIMAIGTVAFCIKLISLLANKTDRGQNNA